MNVRIKEYVDSGAEVIWRNICNSYKNAKQWGISRLNMACGLWQTQCQATFNSITALMHLKTTNIMIPYHSCVCLAHPYNCRKQVNTIKIQFFHVTWGLDISVFFQWLRNNSLTLYQQQAWLQFHHTQAGEQCHLPSEQQGSTCLPCHAHQGQQPPLWQRSAATRANIVKWWIDSTCRINNI